ncbi:hypothetical protein HYS84_01135 [Candidatus Saccharibacteria bacterium]|nr:hypothetical protein [Candidatus Saccharibacteria bacterium]
MAEKAFPRHKSGLVAIPQERILLPQVEIAELDWPVNDIRFNRKACVLIVDVDEPGLVDRLIDQPALSEFGELGFQPKQGLHMTVIGYENGGQILEALDLLSTEEQDELIKAVTDTAGNMDWSWRPSGELESFRGRKRKVLKIISRVECPTFNHFYNELGRLIPSAKFKIYPPHITILRQPGEVKQPVPSSIGGVALNRPILSMNHPTFEG